MMCSHLKRKKAGGEKPKCHDCGEDIISTHNVNHYMVKREVWKRYGIERGYLCLSCLEKRMGRQLIQDEVGTCSATRNNKVFIQRGFFK